MKKLTKIMLSLAAASAVTIAMAVTAMAEDTITGTYNNETGQVTMDGVIGSGKSQTILVLDDNVEPGIAYINQIDNNGTFSSFMLEAGLQSTTPVTYNIKIGGSDKSLQTGTLTISATTPATVTITIGDVSGDNKVNAMDLTQLGRKVKGLTTNIGHTGEAKTKADGNPLTIGDVSGDNKVNAMDLTQLGRKVKGLTTNIGHTGETVDVLDESAE